MQGNTCRIINGYFQIVTYPITSRIYLLAHNYIQMTYNVCGSFGFIARLVKGKIYF
jgi:hypothetical protein